MKKLLTLSFIFAGLTGQVYAACSTPTAEAGSIEWSTADTEFQYCDGTSWLPLTDGNGYWSQTGSNVYYNSGDVGIGTSTPTVKLEVVGDMRLNDGSPQYYYYESDNADLSWATVVDARQWTLRINNTAPYAMYVSESGYVGIGGTPGYKLDVFGNLRAYNGDVLVDHSTGDSTLRFNDAGVNSWKIARDDNQGNDLVFYGYSGASDDILFQPNASTAMTITSGGNVGIGTTTPVHSLSILRSYANIALTPLSSDEQVSIRLSTSDTTGWQMYARGATRTAGDQQGDMGFAYYNGSTWVTPLVLQDTGNVGIGGIAHPSEKLGILGNIGFDNASTEPVYIKGKRGSGRLTIVGNSSVLDGPGIELNGPTKAGYENDLTLISGVGGNIRFLDYNGSIFDQNMIIDTAGNVGIGTATPNQDLELRKASGAPDFLMSQNGTTSIHMRTDGSSSYINNMDNFVSNGSSGNGKLVITGQTGINFNYGSSGAVGTTGLSMNSSGQVGIGTTTPTAALHVSDTATGSAAFIVDGGYSGANIAEFRRADGVSDANITMNASGGKPSISFDTGAATQWAMGNRANGNFGISINSRNVDGGNNLINIANTGVTTIYGTSTCTLASGTGTTSCTSDRRLKDDIRPLENSLEKVAQLEGVHFKWKKDPSVERIGLIAQNVEEVFPEVVSTDEETDMKSVSYPSLVAPLIEAVKELKAQNEELRARVSALEAMQ